MEGVCNQRSSQLNVIKPGGGRGCSSKACARETRIKKRDPFSLGCPSPLTLQRRAAPGCVWTPTTVLWRTLGNQHRTNGVAIVKKARGGGHKRKHLNGAVYVKSNGPCFANTIQISTSIRNTYL